MAGPSSIEWTDATWNPFRGCRKISPGCKHCYAETFAERWRGVKGHPYEQGFDPRFVPEALSAPLHWKKPRRVFVNSMSDIFLEDFTNEQIAAVFGVMAACPQHTFQVLTKRSPRMRAWFAWVDMRQEDGKSIFPSDSRDWRIRQMLRVTALRMGGEALRQTVEEPWPLPNVWLGVSVEDQAYADERIPDLLATPAAVRFVSYEPAIGPVIFSRYLPDDGETGMLDWIIVGGESGHGARPFDVAWARDTIRQCDAAGVACFVKQMGDGAWDLALGKPISLSKKGGDWSEWPEYLRVRQYPKGTIP